MRRAIWQTFKESAPSIYINDNRRQSPSWEFDFSRFVRFQTIEACEVTAEGSLKVGSRTRYGLDNKQSQMLMRSVRFCFI
jgi:hypothetical protein